MKNLTPILLPLLILPMVMLTACDKEDDAVHTAQQAEQRSAVQTQQAIHPGKALHDANCISCHDSSVYTREGRKITDFPKLLAQTQRCDANLGSRLFDDEIALVADYLNQTYYQYEK